MTETVELKPSYRNVYLVGKVKLRDDSFKIDVQSNSGYTYNSVNFGVETAEGNVVYVELIGGYAKNPLPIKAMTKNNTEIEVNWADRNNEKIIEQIADFRLYKASLAENEVKNFLSQYDFIAYLKSKLVDGMEVNVRGQMKFSVYKGEEQRKIEITGISLPYQKKDKETGELLPVEYRATFTQTILIDESSLNITSEDEELGETILRAYAVDYIGKYEGEQIKKYALFPFPLTVKLDGKGAIIAERLFTVDDDAVTEITVEGDIIEGYDKSEDVDIEITDDIQELIDLGLYTKEDVLKRVQIRGNKVSKLVFVRPSVTKSEEGVAEIKRNFDKYKPSDLYFFEQAINGEEEENTSHNEDSIGEEDSKVSDEDWLKELGM